MRAEIDAFRLQSTLRGSASVTDRHGAQRRLDVTKEDAVIRPLPRPPWNSAVWTSSCRTPELLRRPLRGHRAIDCSATWTYWRGYFLVSREAFRLLNAPKLGGAIVFVASRTGSPPRPAPRPIATAKAAEIHLARCLALKAPPTRSASRGEPRRGAARSKIWWGMARAAAPPLQDEARRS